MPKPKQRSSSPPAATSPRSTSPPRAPPPTSSPRASSPAKPNPNGDSRPGRAKKTSTSPRRGDQLRRHGHRTRRRRGRTALNAAQSTASASGRSGQSQAASAADPSRTTPDGNALLFESRADLDRLRPRRPRRDLPLRLAGRTNSSASPATRPGARPPATRACSRYRLAFGDAEPFSSYAYVANLRADGRRAFFQSSEALVARRHRRPAGRLRVGGAGRRQLRTRRRLPLPDLLRPECAASTTSTRSATAATMSSSARSDLLLPARRRRNPLDLRRPGRRRLPRTAPRELPGRRLPAQLTPAACPVPHARSPRRQRQRQAANEACPKGKRKVKRERQGPLRQEAPQDASTKEPAQEKGGGK